MLILESLNTALTMTKFGLKEIIDISRRYLTLETVISNTEGRVTALTEEGCRQLQHVDLVFRFYLPLYALYY